MCAKLASLVAVIVKGRCFGDEVCGLRQFHLDGVDPGLRLAVVTRRPTALEAAIQNAGITFR
ncbi:hypothetical protein D3C80_1603670 [compost metagenome]